MVLGKGGGFDVYLCFLFCGDSIITKAKCFCIFLYNCTYGELKMFLYCKCR